METWAKTCGSLDHFDAIVHFDAHPMPQMGDALNLWDPYSRACLLVSRSANPEMGTELPRAHPESVGGAIRYD